MPTRGGVVGDDIMVVSEGNLPNSTRYIRGRYMYLIDNEKVWPSRVVVNSNLHTWCEKPQLL